MEDKSFTDRWHKAGNLLYGFIGAVEDSVSSIPGTPKVMRPEMVGYTTIGIYQLYSERAGILKDFFGEDAYRNLLRMINMSEHALEDIVRLADLEINLVANWGLALAEKDEFFRDEFFGHGRGPFQNSAPFDIDKRTHNFVAEISTVVDNLYELVINFYNLDVERGHDTKEKTRDELKKQGHSKLAKILNDKFHFSTGYKNFDALRNYAMHGLPRYALSPDNRDDALVEYDFDEQKGELYRTSEFKVIIKYRHMGKEVEEPLYDFMFGIYRHVLESTASAVKLICEDAASRRRLDKGKQ